jgi:serine/threonine-protein kinase HipA
MIRKLSAGEHAELLGVLLRIGTSAGGARAKAIVAFHPETGALRSGTPDVAAGFESWLVKFDGVAANRDHDDADPTGVGAIEFAYSTMVVAAGIEMTPCRLLEEGGRRHFMTRRFDRDPDGGRQHMQSFGAIAHLSYNRAGAYSYELLFDVAQSLDAVRDGTAEELFRRMTFNVVARNHDDHVKNFAFLMDAEGRWRISPAYDITFAYRPGSHWIGQHQISLNGRRDGFTREDLRAAAQHMGVGAARADAIVDQVRDVVAAWPEHAAAAGVAEEHVERIRPALRLELPAE